MQIDDVLSAWFSIDRAEKYLPSDDIFHEFASSFYTEVAKYWDDTTHNPRDFNFEVIVSNILMN